MDRTGFGVFITEADIEVESVTKLDTVFDKSDIFSITAKLIKLELIQRKELL
jgi:hypothetical protein